MASLPDRPKALTDEVQGAILDGLSLGLHFGPACFRAGIDPTSVKYWLDLVESGAEHAQVYADFSQKIKRAVAFAEELSLSTLKAGQPGWQAQAWFLERRFPKRWGQKSKVEIEANFDPSKLSDEELAAITKPGRRRRT
jgi:hypothetical protein